MPLFKSRDLSARKRRPPANLETSLSKASRENNLGLPRRRPQSLAHHASGRQFGFLFDSGVLSGRNGGRSSLGDVLVCFGRRLGIPNRHRTKPDSRGCLRRLLGRGRLVVSGANSPRVFAGDRLPGGRLVVCPPTCSRLRFDRRRRGLHSPRLVGKNNRKDGQKTAGNLVSNFAKSCGR